MNQQHEYIGTRKLLIGIVLAVITFWLFANSLINVIPNLQTSFGSYLSTISIAVSLTALFLWHVCSWSGQFGRLFWTCTFNDNWTMVKYFWLITYYRF